MIAYYFRFVDSNDEPTGYVGFAFAEDMREPFWQIDQHGDPFSVQIQKAHCGSYCHKHTIVRSEDEDFDDDHIYTEQEFCGRLPNYNDEDGWKTPKWPDNRYEAPRVRG